MTPEAPPKGCTCWWSNTPTRGSVYMADPDCPARPHPSRWKVKDGR